MSQVSAALQSAAIQESTKDISMNRALGELLIRAGISSKRLIEEAAQVAESKRLPLGKILVDSAHLADGDLRSAEQANWMLNRGMLSVSQAVRALRFAYDHCLPFSEVLELLKAELTSQVSDEFNKNRLLKA